MSLLRGQAKSSQLWDDKKVGVEGVAGGRKGANVGGNDGNNIFHSHIHWSRMALLLSLIPTFPNAPK